MKRKKKGVGCLCVICNWENDWKFEQKGEKAWWQNHASLRKNLFETN